MEKTGAGMPLCDFVEEPRYDAPKLGNYRGWEVGG